MDKKPVGADSVIDLFDKFTTRLINLKFNGRPMSKENQKKIREIVRRLDTRTKDTIIMNLNDSLKAFLIKYCEVKTGKKFPKFPKGFIDMYTLTFDQIIVDRKLIEEKRLAKIAKEKAAWERVKSKNHKPIKSD